MINYIYGYMLIQNGADVMIDRKLEIFRMAATLGSFTGAAAALGMSQPNVTHQLAQLEADLGVALFIREGRNVRLTAAGRELLGACGQLFDDAEKIRRSVRYAAAKLRYFAVGGTMTAGGYLLPGLIAGYMRSHSAHSLSLSIANTRGIEELLLARKLELALVEGPFERGCFMSEEFTDDELVPVFAPGFAAENFSLAEYLQHGGRLILREHGSGTRYYFERFLHERGINYEPGAILEVNSFDALKLLVREGLGITVISRYAVLDELSGGVLNYGCFLEGRIWRKLNFIFLSGADHRFIDNFITFCRHNFKGFSPVR